MLFGWLLCRTLRFMYTTVEAAVTLHNRLLQHMLRLPKAFFDTNPAGARSA
jgi:ATP-binding cassette subfamily C (CFTR/MRP) protein 1